MIQRLPIVFYLTIIICFAACSQSGPGIPADNQSHLVPTHGHGGADETTSGQIVAVTPANGETNVATHTDIVLDFSKKTEVSRITISLRKTGSNEEVRLLQGNTGTRISFKPETILETDGEYQVSVMVKTHRENSLQKKWKFCTAKKQNWHRLIGSAMGDYNPHTLMLKDGNYLLAGETSAGITTLEGLSPIAPYVGARDIFVSKLTPAGEILWFTFVGSSSDDLLNDIVENSNGELEISGNVRSQLVTAQNIQPRFPFVPGQSARWVQAKLSATGTLLRHDYFGDDQNNINGCRLAPAPDGSILIGCRGPAVQQLQGLAPLTPYISSYGVPNVHSQSILFGCLNSDNSIRWFSYVNSLYGSSSKPITLTQDGGFLLAGTGSGFVTLAGKTAVTPPNGTTNSGFLKFNASGNLEWFTFIPGFTAYDTKISRDGRLIMAGFGAIASLQADGTFAWKKDLPGYYAYWVDELHDGTLITTGYTAAEQSGSWGQLSLSPFTKPTEAVVAKFTPNGNLAWFTYIGCESAANISWANDNGFQIRETRDGGYLYSGTVCGNVSSPSGKAQLGTYQFAGDFMLAKMLPDGSF